MKITSKISLVVTGGDLTGKDIIEFAEELKTRNAAADEVHCHVQVHAPDRGTFPTHTVELSHTVTSPKGTP